MGTVTEALELIKTAMTGTWDLMTSNPWLAITIGVSLVGLGFEFFGKSRGLARGV